MQIFCIRFTGVRSNSAGAVYTMGVPEDLFGSVVLEQDEYDKMMTQRDLCPFRHRSITAPTRTNNSTFSKEEVIIDFMYCVIVVQKDPKSRKRTLHVVSDKNIYCVFRNKI